MDKWLPSSQETSLGSQQTKASQKAHYIQSETSQDSEQLSSLLDEIITISSQSTSQDSDSTLSLPAAEDMYFSDHLSQGSPAPTENFTYDTIIDEILAEVQTSSPGSSEANEEHIVTK